MQNGRAMLLGICCVLYVASTALGQSESRATSDNPTLSQSESVTIIQAIHASELQTREQIDKKSGELGEKISNLEKNVALLDKEVSNLRWWLIILTTLILLPLFLPGLRWAWQKWIRGDSPSFTIVKEFGKSSGFSSKLPPRNIKTEGGSQ